MNEMVSEPVVDSGTSLPLSKVLDQTISDMATNGMDECGTSPPHAHVPNDQFSLKVAENGATLMDGCSMSLEGCLNGDSSPYTHTVPRSNNRVDFTTDDQSQDHTNEVWTNKKMFCESGSAPHHPGDNQRSGSLWHNGIGGQERFNCDQTDERLGDGSSGYPPDGPNQVGPPSTGLHRLRLRARDHPTWLSEGVREKIHLNELQDTIAQLKEVMMMNRLTSAGSLPPPPH